MKILVINAGSSSLKYQLLDMDNEKLLAKGLCERIGIKGSCVSLKANGIQKVLDVELKNHDDAMEVVLKLLLDKENNIISSLKEINAVGHRVLHGGEIYKHSVIVNDEVMKNLEALKPLGPLHMPANISGIKACQEIMPGVPQVAVFDTAFHSTMPDYAYMYGTPYEWYEKYKVRKYGFHGTSHNYIMNELAKALGKDPKDLKIISCHIGNGASVCAIKNGKCVDTSMGFTPLEGLLMGSRCGNIDPAVIEFVMNKEGKTISEMLNILNKESGLLGMSGVSSDSRDVVKGAKEGNLRCQMANNRFVFEIKKYIGAYAAVMNGVDGIALSAGVGENAKDIREAIMKDMEYLGVDFDFDANNNFERGKVWRLSKPTSKVAVYIIPTDEELMIAQDTQALTKKK